MGYGARYRILSRQLTVLIGQEYKDGVPDDIFAYKLEIIKDIVYRNDMPKVERAIRHVTRGTDERMDLNFRYVDKHGKSSGLTVGEMFSMKVVKSSH